MKAHKSWLLEAAAVLHHHFREQAGDLIVACYPPVYPNISCLSLLLTGNQINIFYPHVEVIMESLVLINCNQ